MLIVSSCLAGVNCRYDGKSNENEYIKKLVEEGKAIPVCPEVLGGLGIPRPPSEIKIEGGQKKVYTKEGKDVTKNFLTGAKKTLEIANIIGAKKAILKSRSPSCGFGMIYDGSFNGVLITGNGLTADLLIKNGIKVYTEENIIKKPDTISG